MVSVKNEISVAADCRAQTCRNEGLDRFSERVRVLALLWQNCFCGSNLTLAVGTSDLHHRYGECADDGPADSRQGGLRRPLARLSFLFFPALLSAISDVGGRRRRSWSLGRADVRR